MDALKSFSVANNGSVTSADASHEGQALPSNENRAAAKVVGWIGWGDKGTNGKARLKRAVEGSSFFLGLIVIALIALFGWMSIAEIDRVVRVEGKIIPAGRAQQVQHYEGGIVASILAHEGRLVKKGDILLTIDNTSADATLNESTAKYTHLKLRAARLEAETKGMDRLEFSSALAKEDGAEAERLLFDSRRTKLLKETQVHHEMIRHHTQALKDAEARRDKLSGELVVAKKRTAIIQEMAARRAASQIELLDAQSREKRLETEITEAENAKPKLNGAIAEEKARIDAIAAEFKASAQDDLVATRAEIDRLHHVLTAETDRVKRTDVRAPIDGVVNKLGVNTVGGVVKPGESLVEITPSTTDALIEARALPKDRGDLRAELPTKIRVSAYDAAEFGTLSGKVTEISADSMQDARGDSYYRVKILVTNLPESYATKPLLPGMTVMGDVVTGRRTLFNHLLSPLRKFTSNMFRDSR